MGWGKEALGLQPYYSTTVFDNYLKVNKNTLLLRNSKLEKLQNLQNPYKVEVSSITA